MIGQVPVSIIFTVFLAFLLWLEIRRKQKSNQALRLLAVSFMLVSLYCIIYPPSWNSRQQGRTGELVILTEGYNADSLKNFENIPVYTTIKERSPSKNVQFIPDVPVFLAEHPGIQNIIILGRGLSKSDLASLKNHRIKFIPGGMPGGVQSISWPKALLEGQQFNVTGEYINKSRSTEKIALRVFGSIADSLEVGAGDTAVFSLTNVPKHLGNAVYELLTLSGRDTLSKNSLPVHVSAKVPLRILVLGNSPDFESRFLKDWLVKNNHSLAVRTRISRDKFSSFFAGLENMSLNPLSSAMLNRFDLVIADNAELSAMSIAQQRVLLSAIQKGLGLLINKTSSDQNTSLFRNSIPTHSNPVPANKSLTFEIENKTISKELGAETELLSVSNIAGSRSLMKIASGKFIAGNKLVGEGKLTVSTLPNSFQWQLQGQDEPYSKYWSYLIQNTARKAKFGEELVLSEQFPTFSHLIPIRISSEKNPLKLEFEKEQIRLAQNSLFANRWQGNIWAKSPGWKDLNLNDSINHSLFIYDSEDWKGIRAIESMQYNEQFAAGRKRAEYNSEEMLVLVKKTIPSVIFCLIFIVCCGFLWLEPKLL